jgi:hypothetical protein
LSPSDVEDSRPENGSPMNSEPESEENGVLTSDKESLVGAPAADRGVTLSSPVSSTRAAITESPSNKDDEQLGKGTGAVQTGIG